MRAMPLLALLLLGARCQDNSVCVQVPDTGCAPGVDLELDWELARVVVEPFDCLKIPEVYALDSRLCCGAECSEPAVWCGVDTPCLVCGRLLDHLGNPR